MILLLTSSTGWKSSISIEKLWLSIIIKKMTSTWPGASLAPKVRGAKCPILPHFSENSSFIAFLCDNLFGFSNSGGRRPRSPWTPWIRGPWKGKWQNIRAHCVNFLKCALRKWGNEDLSHTYFLSTLIWLRGFEALGWLRVLFSRRFYNSDYLLRLTFSTVYVLLYESTRVK